MRQIVKGAEPASLMAHRKSPHCDYDNYGPKDDLRLALVTEQRGLCCYCMGRIHNVHASMKIEHWRCRSRYPGEQLNYRILLGACLGGHEQPFHLQHCDTRKGDSDLLWNPANAVHHIETRIRYGMDGSIHADDAVFNDQLSLVLNLNLTRLKNNRKGALDGVLTWWRLEKRKLGGPVPRDRLERKRDSFLAGNGNLEPFSPIAVWWLGQRLAGTAA